MTLYRIEVGLRGEVLNHAGFELKSEIKALNMTVPEFIRTARLYWLEADFSLDSARRLAHQLFCDPLVEKVAVDEPLYDGTGARRIEIVRKPGVMDPVVESIRKALSDLKLSAGHIATGRQYLFYYPERVSPVPGVPETDLAAGTRALMFISRKILANECIEEIHIDRRAPVHPPAGEAPFVKRTIKLIGKDDVDLVKISVQGCLSLTLAEMKTIQKHFVDLGRDPTDVELETVAQTWSEHCRHKTLRGGVEFTGPDGNRTYTNLLKETIVHATETIRHARCLSVFKDNAGVIAFDDTWALTFKVETHNHPSAIEPYGGAGTGIGGVIRDTMGTGLGAKPIANTDIFCFGMPGTSNEALPPGTLHPRRVMSGVVAGVRDYGNRMGIPTVNGAVQFDPRYVGNPLVYCGSIGLLPRNMISKRVVAGDLVVVLGGRTGRDGIHGATFSSVELSEHSEMVSSGAVQIGNAIEEKKVLDVLLQARDAGLYTCVTDCGAGGLSSAVGEMGEELGAVVQLEKVPLKYAGLTYTEIWISEAQERMVVSVPPAKWPTFQALCKAEDVEGTVIGTFGNGGPEKPMLRLEFKGTVVADLSMKFLHDGLPTVTRQARWKPTVRGAGDSWTLDAVISLQRATGLNLKGIAKARSKPATMYGPLLRKLLSHPTLASKEWIIRQYDHEVQARTAIKPLVGVNDDGPGDAAVLTPLVGSTRAVAIGCGLCPQFTDRDPKEMARLAVDECLRNLVAVGGDPDNTFILDNFCWGNTSKPEQLGSLVLCCEGATEAAIAYGTPFISGKDSLNNEYSVSSGALDAHDRTIAIPGTLLISGMALVEDIRCCTTSDVKKAGNLLYILGQTREELGCSHFNLISGAPTHVGQLPRVDLKLALATFRALHRAIASRLVCACHDLSEGGLAVAAAEMAFAGGLGLRVQIDQVPVPQPLPTHVVLFSESPSRFLVEVAHEQQQAFEAALRGVPCACIGEVIVQPRLQCAQGEELWIDEAIEDLKRAWQTDMTA